MFAYCNILLLRVSWCTYPPRCNDYYSLLTVLTSCVMYDIVRLNKSLWFQRSTCASLYYYTACVWPINARVTQHVVSEVAWSTIFFFFFRIQLIPDNILLYVLVIWRGSRNRPFRIGFLSFVKHCTPIISQRRYIPITFLGRSLKYIVYLL